MSIEIREAVSEEIKNTIKTVRKMTEKMAFDENMADVNWSSVRIISDLGYKFMPKERDVKVTKVELSGVKAELSVPEKLTSEDVIMYIHGGGFVSGSATASRAYCSMLAKYAGCRVFAVNYSLAPEKPFPNGFRDCYNAYKDIARTFTDSKIAIVGESAGGNLALGVTHRIIDRNIRKPSCVIAHSPLVDFSGSIHRNEREIDDFTVKIGCFKPLKDIYVKEHYEKNPYISPIYGDFSKFPPLFLTCDMNETLFADSVAVYNKCLSANRNVRMIQMKGAFHAFAVAGTETPETKQILVDSIDFFKKHSN